MKKKYVLMLDVETCPMFPSNEVNAHNMLVYDIGYAICDLHKNVLAVRSFIVSEIFFGELKRMNSAYYAKKIPAYLKDIADGYREVKTWNEIHDIIRSDCEDYGVTTVAAHNAYFDYTAINNTKKYLSKDYLLPSDYEWWDTLKMARSSIGKTKKYQKFCEENSFMTAHKKPRPRHTAEILYRYLNGNLGFEESHTGLEDVLVECDIMWACLDTHLKLNRKLWKD